LLKLVKQSGPAFYVGLPVSGARVAIARLACPSYSRQRGANRLAGYSRLAMSFYNFYKNNVAYFGFCHTLLTGFGSRGNLYQQY
jgi:hypothetical protein